SAYAEWGRQDLAIEDYSRAIALQPGDLVLWRNRALSYFKTAQYDRALSDLKEFARLGGTPDPSLIRQIEQELKKGNTNRH
ncbi:MAG TPA: tetratricopeptide repeat protein, partial [Candidatus Binatus sp.]|nr:tetratricopeptide repeat protein [Candidatus Binatus sp.]